MCCYGLTFLEIRNASSTDVQRVCKETGIVTDRFNINPFTPRVPTIKIQEKSQI